jgi:hypothetical protein
MLEKKHQIVAPLPVFAKRMAETIGTIVGLIIIALFMGMAGYHWVAGLSWVDSLLNASMILGGMGPVDNPSTNPAKIFASLYALFSGLVFIAVMGIFFAPIMHRVLHKFHIDDKEMSK